MNKLLAATGLSLAIASGSVSALQIDFSGSGSIAGSKFFSEVSWDSSSAILTGVQDPALLSFANPGVFVAQAKFSFGAGQPDIMTYQLSVPVISTQTLLGPLSTVNVSLAGPGTFRIFLDPTPAANQITGAGFGNIGGPLNPGQVLIASGTVSLSSVFLMTIQDFLGHLPLDPPGAPNALAPQNATRSVPINGSVNFNVDITFQNNLYVVSDLVNAGLSLDMTLQDMSLTAPFTAPNVPSQRVAGILPFFGLVEVGPGARIQDSFCVSAGPFCDLEMQIGSNSKFFDLKVPEPGTLALAGLGLSLIGLRRRKHAA